MEWPCLSQGPAGSVDKHHGTGEIQNIAYIHFTNHSVYCAQLATVTTQVRQRRERSLGRNHLIRAGVSSLAVGVLTSVSGKFLPSPTGLWQQQSVPVSAAWSWLLQQRTFKSHCLAASFQEAMFSQGRVSWLCVATSVPMM